MSVTRPRRALLLGLAASLLPKAAAAAGVDRDRIGAAQERLAAIERREGGRLGVAVLDSASGAMIGHRADERFPLCSTFKLLAAAAVLARVDAGADRLDRVVPYGDGELLDYAPIARAHLAEGRMTLGDLCAAALQWSDNTAGNLVLAAIGGPAGVTDFARGLGDAVTRLDRTEPTLNTAIPGDERDTTSPAAIVNDLKTILLGEALAAASRRKLLDWLEGDQVGSKRLRAGLPPSWRIGDKTGSGDRATTNTIGILIPPDRAPILAAVYHTGSPAGVDARNAVHAEIATLIAATL